MGFKFVQPRFGPVPRRLRELKRGDVRRAASKAIVSAVEDLIQNQFDERRAPNGSAWAPRKPPTGSWPLLERSGAMRRGFKVIATSAQLQIHNSTDYLKYHQNGTAKMVARPVLPGSGLTPDWQDYIDASVASALEKALS